MNSFKIFLCALLTIFSVDTLAAEFFVAPDGDDMADGSQKSPFKTIARARDAVRELSPSERKSGTTVYLRAGRYTLSGTLVLDRRDGNTTYRSYCDETPIISSGVAVKGWQKVTDFPAGTPASAKGNLWVADMPNEVDDFKVMFSGGHILQRARSRGFQSPQQNFRKWASRNVKFEEDRSLLRRLEFPEGIIKDWDNIEDVEVFFCGVPWSQNISPIESVDLENNLAWLKYEGNTPPFTTPKPYNPARIENVIDVLDMPGEWCVNTQTRKIYYWPINEAPSEEIYVPRLTELVRVEGQINYDKPVDEPVRNINFKGLTFTQADRYSWWKGHKGWGIQHDWDKFDHNNAMLRFRGAESCLVDQCRFVNSGSSAVRLDLHAQEISIENSLIDGVGHMGILLCGYGPGTKDVNKNNRIVNNIIRHTGELIWHGHAIFIWQSGENYFANNHIREVPRKAIGLCGVRGSIFKEGKEVDWDEGSKTMRWEELGCESFQDEGNLQYRLLPYLHARNNLIENNYVYRSRTKIGDGSSLNVSGAGTGNVLRRNMLDLSLGNGMRCDDWQCGTVFAENILLSGGMVHKGRNNYTNNILINCNIRFTPYPGEQSDPGSKINRNIFYFTHYREPYRTRVGNNGLPDPCDISENIYFCESGNRELKNFLASEKYQGEERGSIIADPQFKRPLDLQTRMTPDNFQLKADSPALKLGFKQICTDQIGLTDEYPRDLRSEVFPALRGDCVSRTATLTATSNPKGCDLQELVQKGAGDSLATIYESGVEENPSVTLELDKVYPINGAKIIADSNSNQNSMRALTVWSSLDGENWTEIWRADPYHIAMGRDWLVKPYEVRPARFVRIGLRPKSSIQLRSEDDRMSLGRYILPLNSIQVFSE